MVAVYCPLCCDQPFENQQALFFHLRGLRNNLYCPICSDKFPTLELLVTHLSRTCNGPLSPSEAKRRSVSTTGVGDQSDLEDEANKSENQISKTSQITIPGKLLKNVSISIKENKCDEQHTGTKKPVQPVVLAVDPRNPMITNGLPLLPAIISVGLNSSLDQTSHLLSQNDTLKQSNNNASTDLTTTCANVAPELEITTNTAASVCTNVSQSTQQVKSEARKRGHNNGTIEDITKRKRGRPRKGIQSNTVTENNSQKEALLEQIDSVVNKTLPKDTPNKQENNLGSIKPTVDNNAINSNLPPCDNTNNHLEGHTGNNDESQGNSISSVDPAVINQDLEANQENPLEDGTKAESEDEYTCSACNVRFISIYEHIKEYHYGQEVVVEVPENEIKEDLKAYQNEKDTSANAGNSSNMREESVLGTIGDVPIATNEETTIVHVANDVQQSKGIGINKKPHVVSKEFYKQYPQLVKEINRLKRSKTGDWLRTKGIKRSCFHFVTDADKMLRLASEFKGNDNIHPVFQVSMKELFENPKINVIAITNKPNTPIFTYKEVDLTLPIPMYIVARKHSKPDGLLGGIASYVITNPSKNSESNDLLDDAKVVAVMNVVLGSDQTLTVENLVFKNKPGTETIIPVLEDISDPEVPLLKGGKLLKWMCKKCMAVTWRFPLSKDSHVCNGCLICHKPFSTRIGLQKHMVLHKKGASAYCEKCHLAFANSKLLETHLKDHENHIRCPLCKLFVPLYQQAQHERLHTSLPVHQFPCSVCHKLFASEDEIKSHEAKACGRLVAKYNCTLCDKKFFSLTSLSYHSREHKSVTIKFPCRYCSKTFVKEKEQCPRKAGKRKPSSYLQKIWHERIHTRDRPFTCSACPKRFRSSDHQVVHSNQAHSTSKHKDVPIHMCIYCDKVFTNEKRLEEHKNKFHLVQQPT